MAQSSALISRKYLSRWHVAAVVAVSLGLAGLAAPLVYTAIVRLARLMAYPYPTDGLEATLLSQAQLLWSGQPLYQPFELYRFVSSPYPPWHPLILGFADQFAGPHPFWSGRMVSLVAGVAVLVTIILFVRFAARSWIAGVFAAVVLLSAPPFVLWATRIKPDMYALMWTTLGLLFGMLAVEPRAKSEKRTTAFFAFRSSLFAFLAALCFALAFFTKQTALAGPVAVGFALVSDDLRNWLAHRRSGFGQRMPLRKRTWVYGIVYLSFVSVTGLLLNLSTNGQFVFHVWVQHRGVLWTAQLMWKYVALLAPMWPLMLVSVGVLWVAWRDTRALVAMWYLVLAPWTLFGAGSTGANHNHLLETMLALALAGGVMLGWAFHHLTIRPIYASAVSALVALQLVLVVKPPLWYGSEFNPQETPERYVRFIRSTPGEVLADNPGLLYLAGKPLRYDDPSSFGPDATSGLWDQRGLIDDIANRRFGAILVPFDTEVDTIDPSGRWTPEVIAAVRDHYRLLYRDTIMTYVPK